MIVVIHAAAVSRPIWDWPDSLALPLPIGSYGFLMATYSQGRISVGCAIQAYLHDTSRLMWTV